MNIESHAGSIYLGPVPGEVDRDATYTCKDGRNVMGIKTIDLDSIYHIYTMGTLYENNNTIGMIGSDLVITYRDYLSGLLDLKVREKLIPSMIHIYLIPNFNQPYISTTMLESVSLHDKNNRIPFIYDTYVKGPFKKPNTKYLSSRMAISLLNSKLPIVLDLRSKSYRDVIILYN